MNSPLAVDQGGAASQVSGIEGVPSGVPLAAVPSTTAPAEIRQAVGNSQVHFSGKAPNIVLRNGDIVGAEQERSCAGTCDTNATVSGAINISAQYLQAGTSEFKLTTDAVVNGDVTVRAEREGTVGGKLDLRLEAKTQGVEVVDTDTDSHGNASKIIAVSAAQVHPLKIVIGEGVNAFDNFEIDVVSSFPIKDGSGIEFNANSGGQSAFLDVTDTLGEDMIRTITLSRGTPPEA